MKVAANPTSLLRAIMELGEANISELATESGYRNDSVRLACLQLMAGGLAQRRKRISRQGDRRWHYALTMHGIEQAMQDPV